MWTYAPPGPLVQLSGQNEHVQNSPTLSKLQTQWLLAHFNLIYLVKENCNAKLSCSSNSCAGPACQRLCLQGLPWAVRAGGSAVLSSSDTGLTSWCKMKQISVKLWLWGIIEQHSLFSCRVRKYWTENLRVSLCGAQIQSPESLRWRIMLALGVQDM